MTGDSSSTQANQGFQREEKKTRNIYQSDSQEGPGRAERVQSAAVRLQTKQLNTEIIQPKQSVMEVRLVLADCFMQEKKRLNMQI